MREMGPATADEMVLSFLRAEIDSPVWGPHYMAVLNHMGVDRFSLIDNAEIDLSDANANRTRANALGLIRGYGRDMLLFRGFPTDTTWRRVQLDPSEFQVLKYINCPPFPQLTDDTRSIEIGARNYRRDEGLAPRVDDVVRMIKSGILTPELILVEDTDRLVVLEGNTRATAYVKAGTSFSALVGSSPTIRQWAFI
jgi:hypothetical protein